MRKPWVHLGAVVMSLALVGAACGGDDTSGATDDTAAGSETTAAAGGSETSAAEETTDSVAGSGATAGALEGMKGTTPLVELSGDFKSRLNDAWVKAGNTELKDFNYAAETYDAVTVIALAVEEAKTDGTAYA
ncbi:MAG: hypothetical protein IT196_19090, partial [Acidimicrobiales bacterium]|nr:hypothetical protein [Acidimicrobiales bacterium]